MTQRKIHKLVSNKYTQNKQKYHQSTRQVYNGPRTSNLSQQQQQDFWSKMIFEQQNQKKFQKKNKFLE